MAKVEWKQSVIIGLRGATQGNVRYYSAQSKVNPNLIYVFDLILSACALPKLKERMTQTIIARPSRGNRYDIVTRSCALIKNNCTSRSYPWMTLVSQYPCEWAVA